MRNLERVARRGASARSRLAVTERQRVVLPLPLGSGWRLIKDVRGLQARRDNAKLTISCSPLTFRAVEPMGSPQEAPA